MILCERSSQSYRAASPLVYNFLQLHIMHAIATVTPQRLQSLRLSGSDHEHPFLHTSQTLVLHFNFSKAKIVFISPCVSTIRTWSFAWSSSHWQPIQNSWNTASRKITRAVCLELNLLYCQFQLSFITAWAVFANFALCIILKILNCSDPSLVSSIPTMVLVKGFLQLT